MVVAAAEAGVQFRILLDSLPYAFLQFSSFRVSPFGSHFWAGCNLGIDMLREFAFCDDKARWTSGAVQVAKDGLWRARENMWDDFKTGSVFWFPVRPLRHHCWPSLAHFSAPCRPTHAAEHGA